MGAVLILGGLVLGLWIAKRQIGWNFSLFALAAMAAIAFIPAGLAGDFWTRFDLTEYAYRLESVRASLIRPWDSPGLVGTTVQGWLWIPLLAGAAWAGYRRWRWLAYNFSGLLVLAMTAWWAAIFLASGRWLVWQGWHEEAAVALAQSGGELGAWGGVIETALWVLLTAARAIPIALLGAMGGAVVAIFPIALQRLGGRGAGFQSRVLSFRHSRGEEWVLCRYRTWNRWRGRYRTERVPLGSFGFTTSEESVNKSVYVPSVTTISGTTTGGQMVYGTAYGPGRSYDTQVLTGWYLARLSGNTSTENVQLTKLQATEARWAAGRIDKVFATPFRDTATRRAREEAEQSRLDQLKRAQESEASALQAVQTLLRSAGMGSGQPWYRYRYDDSGALVEVLAADREGRAVALYSGGRERWMGSWNGAQVKGSHPALEIMVEDLAYREKHLCNRRVVIAETWTQALRDEWASRIELLALG